ncbi:MAG: outer membrane beta-barrel protein [Bacteroidales bacterium]|nr:outer membrane beta-barrel protein [Bacteroidales bacterium]MCF8455062.1 outer membrane beta-barrel protein [Bacteroidales bacterium]
MKIKSFLILILLISVASSVSFSQGKFSAHVGAAVPMGKFGSDDLNASSSGFAGFGGSIGFHYNKPINKKGLGVFVKLDFAINPLFNADLRKGIKEANEVNSQSYEIKFINYLNLPISLGLNYTLKPIKKVSVFGEAGITSSFLKMTNYKHSIIGSYLPDVGYVDQHRKQKHKLSFSIGFSLSGGICFFDKIEIGINYYRLGEHKIKTEWDETVEYWNTTDVKQGNSSFNKKVSLLMFTIGYRF